MSTLAVFLCLGGTAVAVSQIDGSTISDRSIAGKKLIKNTVTGTEIAESTLGKVPDAAKLDGLDSTKFVTGSGDRLISYGGPLSSDATFHTVFDWSGVGRFKVSCSNGANLMNWRFVNTSTGVERGLGVDYAAGVNGTGGQDAVDPGAYYNDYASNSSPDSYFNHTITVYTQNQQHVAELHLVGFTDVGGAGNTCEYVLTGQLH